MGNKIQFLIDEQFQDIPWKPEPSKRSIPDWMRNMPLHCFAEDPLAKTIKGCPPVTDAISTGYTIPLWFEFMLSSTDDGQFEDRSRLGRFENPYAGNNEPPISFHFPVQYKSEYFKDHFIFKLTSPWSMKTPPGYSVLILPPLYRNDLPFEILPAVLDTDDFTTSFSFTCKIKKQDEAQVHIFAEPGTPLAQIIPFKRETWESEVVIHTHQEQSRKDTLIRSYLSSGYKKLFWKKKDYK